MKTNKANHLARLAVLSVSFFGALFAGLAGQAQTLPGSGSGLRGEYFANTSLSGAPVLTRTDRQISFIWGNNTPAQGLPADGFSVRWKGQLEAPVTGRYTLRPIADDVMRIHLDGRKIVDIQPSGNQLATTTVQVDLAAGKRYPLEVEFVEKSGMALAALQWSYPGMGQEVIPTSRLYSANEPPVVRLTEPDSQASYAFPATVALAADASDVDGSIAKVEFFSGATKLGEDATAPFQWSWAGVGVGTYSLTARATDNSGASSTSAPVSVEVVKPAFVDVTTPTPASVTAGAATMITTKVTCNSGFLGGGIVDLEIYNAAGVRVAQQIWEGQNWATGDQRSNSFAWVTPNTPGTYTVKTGVFNSTWGMLYYWNNAAATVTVTKSTPTNAPPVVSLTRPSVGAAFTAPATIELKSSASDSDGSISKVEFFAAGAKLGEDAVAPYSWSWRNVPAGIYAITVRATDNVGAVTTSAPAQVTVNPLAPPPSGMAVAVPTNLRIRGHWDAAANRPTDVLTWDPTPGAASYNVYQYDVLIAKGVEDTSLLVPPSVYYAYLTYAVTAVSQDGAESIPSNIVLAQGVLNPNLPPPYTMPEPTIPSVVKATPEWNVGRPRVRLSWFTTATARYQDPNETYNIYRDGVRVAAGLWGLTYVDTQVQPGATHTYQVTGANLNWRTTQESAPSQAITVKALAQAPALMGTPVVITSIVPNDDSVVVTVSATPGAADYRCYVVGKPWSRKYSGGGLSIEMNGLDPVAGADLVVEAVDKLGPFQKHDGFQGPGMMQHDGTMFMEVNGQGDPSNVPNVLARTQPFHVSCKPRIMSGEQVFFDNFRDSQPFVWAEPPASLLPNANGLVKALQNDKWLLYNVQGDLDNSQFFVQGSHFMDTFFDGDRPGGPGPLHNNVASFLMMPRKSADISGGKVLHVTFEVDPHMGPRRWCDLFVADANDPLTVPGKFQDFNQLPTKSGNLFRWELLDTIHGLQLFTGPGGQLKTINLIDDPWGIARRKDFSMKGTWNGGAKDLDLRRRYDLYLSQTHYRILEGGTVIKDGAFPAGVKLPFTNAAVYFVHQVYHTGAERPSLTVFYPNEAYWHNHRPYSDERHWDNMGFEVLPAFPALTSTAPQALTAAGRSVTGPSARR